MINDKLQMIKMIKMINNNIGRSYLHRRMSEGKSASWRSRVCDER